MLQLFSDRILKVQDFFFFLVEYNLHPPLEWITLKVFSGRENRKKTNKSKRQERFWYLKVVDTLHCNWENSLILTVSYKKENKTATFKHPIVFILKFATLLSQHQLHNHHFLKSVNAGGDPTHMFPLLSAQLLPVDLWFHEALLNGITSWSQEQFWVKFRQNR